jgi:prepilin signal peptidase PulO-like enzyme (type II secretory pathway)
MKADRVPPFTGLAVIFVYALALLTFLSLQVAMISKVLTVSLIVGSSIQSWTDLHTRHVYRSVTYAMAIIVVLVYLYAGRLLSMEAVVATGVGGSFLGVHRARAKSLGFGDVLMAPVLAMHIGWYDIRMIAVWLLLSSVGAAVTGYVSQSSHIAFIPWLTGSAIAVIMYQTVIS